MHGYRKMIIALVAMGGAFFIQLNAHQADVIIYVACALILGNSAKGIGGQIIETLRNRVTDGNRGTGSSAPGDS